MEYPDETTKRFEIPVEGKGFEEAKLDIVKSMKDYDILIEGDMEWSEGTWNTFTMLLDDDEEFDAKKIKAVGEYGLIINYTYDGEEFISKEEINKIEPYLLSEDKKSVQYTRIEPLLIEAIKDLSTKVDKQNKIIDKMGKN